MSVIVVNRRSLGVNFSSRGEAEVLVWAPHASTVVIIVRDSGLRIMLHKEPRGDFSCITPHLKPGDHYWVELDQQHIVPDPASLLQPEGVSGPSQVFSHGAFHWTDREWKNLPLREYIMYELHVGTFSRDGTFNGIIQRLPYLKQLGITAIELMPVAEFPGSRNWGYDGVFPFAAHHTYGGPRGLQELVNACHGYGIAVVLDVVYNHFGPEGNILDLFGPYFTDKYKTPWGKAINFDDAGCDEVRKYFIENALMWFRDFHVDALRLDAVHAIRDFGAVHFLQELRAYVNELNTETQREHYLIAECDLNDPRYLQHESRNGYGMDAQWIDEFHHSLRVASGHEATGYYSDFREFISLSKAFSNAYVYDGQYSEHRQKTFGRPADGLSGDHFVVFSQNHDQVGNTMLGERTSVLVDAGLQKVMAAAVLCSPYIPMLFMGEEYGERQPFQYFISHEGEELIRAVQEGRRNEFAAFFQHDREVPDPQAESTFQNSKLNWSSLNKEEHQCVLDYYRELISIRKSSPVLSACSRENLSTSVQNEKCLVVSRKVGTRQSIAIFNFCNSASEVQLPEASAMVCLLNSASARWMGTDSTDPLYNVKLTVPAHTFLLYENQ